jgi:hypothetical protein
MSGQAQQGAPTRRSARRERLLAAIHAVRAKRLPRPPNAVLARLCGYSGDTQVCHAIRRMIAAGIITRADWPHDWRCDRALWRGRV